MTPDEFAALIPPLDPAEDDYQDFLYEWARNRLLSCDESAIDDLDADAINQLTRGCLHAPAGRALTVVDFASIEARVNAWGARDEPFLQVFRDGRDPYRVCAAQVFDLAYESVKKGSRERDLGKRLELGCGYSMGSAKFHASSIDPKNGKPVDWTSLVPLFRDRLAARGAAQTWATEGDPAWALAVCELLVHDGWRQLHPAIVQYWADLEDAAKEAACGGSVDVGPTHWERIGDAVWCILPSDRPLIYQGMHLATRAEADRANCAAGAKGLPERARAGQLVSSSARGLKWYYGGLLCENVTQAIARDIMAAAAVRLARAGYELVLHVHDEIVCEVPWADRRSRLAEQQAIMCEVPSWAAGMPIAGEGFWARRYRK